MVTVANKRGIGGVPKVGRVLSNLLNSEHDKQSHAWVLAHVVGLVIYDSQLFFLTSIQLLQVLCRYIFEAWL